MFSKQPRTFHMGDKQVVFNAQLFNKNFKSFQQRNNLLVGDLEQRIANKTHVSPEAVHNWRFMKNGPGSLEIIQEVANVLDITDWTLLTKEINGDSNMIALTDRQKDSAKRIYDICILFLTEFNNTDGFHSYWYQFTESKDPKTDIISLVDEKFNKILLVLDQEFFDLHGHEIYNEFFEFVYEELQNTFDGKLSQSYRLEALSNGGPTTSEDYDKAMKKLNSIIEKYI